MGLRRRSPVAWASRVALAIVALGVGWVGTAQVLGHAAKDDGQRAHARAPWSGRTTAEYARQLAGENATGSDRANADILSRKALRQDPTAVAAVTTLGVDAQVRGDVRGARRLFAYAETLSRRDLSTQLWGIEDAVGRGDVPGALRHYDIALRTSRNAPAVLYPILGSAIVDPAVRAALVRTLVARPSWGESFVNYVAGNGSDARATAALFYGLRRSGVPIAAEANAVVVNALILGSYWDAAWRYYAGVRQVSDRRRSRDPHFRAELALPSPFDWTPVNDAGIIGSIQRDGDNGVFLFAAPTGVGGPLLTQVQVLPAGDYRLVGRSRDINQPEESRPYWVLSCRGPASDVQARELGRVAIPNSAQDGGRFAGRLNVPADCPVQVLALNARPSDAMAGTTGQIDAVELMPLS